MEEFKTLTEKIIVGIYDRRSARRMMAEFRRRAKEARPPLEIRMEALENGE